jgi:PEP-CTERM motif
MKFRVAAGALLSLMLGASAAHANLITNGDFETGTTDGWTTSGFVAAFSDSGAPYGPNSGNYYAAFWSYFGAPSLSQTVSDTAGQTLQLTYYVDQDGYSGNSFKAEWDGTTIDGSAVTGNANTDYMKFVFDVKATGSDTLMFWSSGDSSFWGLDDVSLVVAPSATVPEPSSTLLLGTAFLAMLGFGLRRIRAVS